MKVKTIAKRYPAPQNHPAKHSNHQMTSRIGGFTRP